MRIIAGINKGRKLKSVPGMATRPTSDRVKEAVFSSIEFQLLDCDFLDVFSGTGNIALEALSRGAKSATMIEKEDEAIKIIRENILLCGVQDQCQYIKKDALHALKELGKQKKRFHIIYVDPPYKAQLYLPILQLIEKEHLLADGGIILLESAKNTSHRLENSIFCSYKEKKYGDTQITYLKNKES